MLRRTNPSPLDFPFPRGKMFGFFFSRRPRMAILRRTKSLLFLVAAVTLFAALAGAQQYDQKLFAGMKWRLVGPFRGGRRASDRKSTRLNSSH